MTILTRVSRLFRADFHAVLDNIEEPDVLLRHAVREMEEALEADNERSASLVQEIKQLDKKILSTQALIEQFSEEVDLCFAADNTQLARNLVRRKLEASATLSSLSSSRDRLASTVESLKKAQEENTQKYQEMKQKSDLFWEESKLRKSESHANACHFSSAVLDDDVEIAFMKEKQRFEGAKS